jgi:hypothetical protein
VPLCETCHGTDTCESGIGVYRITGTMPQPHMQIQIQVVMMLEIFQVPRALPYPNASRHLIHEEEDPNDEERY